MTCSQKAYTYPKRVRKGQTQRQFVLALAVSTYTVLMVLNTH